MINEQEKREGLEFIVGSWQPDYVVNALSNDLKHIPASEFKGEDGLDLTTLKLEFCEDHRVEASGAYGRTDSGEWEQTSNGEFRIRMNELSVLPEGSFKDSVQTLTVSDGKLVFAIGFLAIALKKTENGVISSQKETVGGPASAPDGGNEEIVGKYEVARSTIFANGEIGLRTKDEAKALLEKQVEAGEIDGDEYSETMRVFDTVIEFTSDHKVITWTPVPEGVSEEEIKEAVEAGEIKRFCGGMISLEEQEWKYSDGKFYYDTGEQREVFGEEKSSWDELKKDENGLITYGSGMMKIKKVE